MQILVTLRTGDGRPGAILKAMKVSAVILCCFLAFSAYPQSRKVLVKLCPLALADVNMPTIQAGFECRLWGKITWYNEFGIKSAKNINERYVDTTVVASRGFKLKSEIRYYFRSKGQVTFDGPYFAANLFYITDMHNRKISYLQHGMPPARVNDFGVKKNVSGFNLVSGYQKSIAKNFFVDLYGGLGLRLRNISTVNKEYNKATDKLLDTTDPNITEIGERADTNGGFSFLPNLTLGIRICYRL